MPKILSGPYGSLIHDILTSEGVDAQTRATLTSPNAILHHDRTQQLVHHVARSYRDHGAQVLTTNTFSTRHLLTNHPDEYTPALQAQLEITQAVAENDREIAVSFGPYGDCYKPEEAPSSVAEGADFWEAAFEPLISAPGNLHYALAETVNSEVEALSIARAWKNIRRHIRGQVDGVISFIPQQQGKELLSGESITEVIRAIQAELGVFPILLGLNCCSIKALEPTLIETADLTRRTPFRFLYPNASDMDPLALEQSPENQVSREPKEVASLLHELLHRYEASLPGATAQVIINECCGGTPQRTKIISKKVREARPLSSVVSFS